MTKRLVYKLNIPENREELVPEDWELRYNIVKGEHEFVPPNAELIPNIVTGTVELRERGKNDRHITNVPANQVELGGEDWEWVYDIVNNKFVMRPKQRDP